MTEYNIIDKTKNCKENSNIFTNSIDFIKSPTGTSHKQKRKRVTTYSEIRKHISGANYNVLIDGKPIQINSEQKILTAKQRKQWAGIHQPNNQDYQEHIDGKQTIYDVGKVNRTTGLILLMFDLDIQKSQGKGTKEDGIRFTQAVTEEGGILPGMLWEPSTNGNGVHGYFFVQMNGMGDEAVAPIADKIQTKLLQFAVSQGFDIENAEIKGRPAITTYNSDNYPIAYHCGQKMKLPRSIEIWKNIRSTCILNVSDIQRIDYLDKLTPDQDQQVHKMKNHGSLDKCITQKDLSLMDRYREIAKELIGGDRVDIGNRRVVHFEDIAIFLLILKFVTENPNDDKTLPGNRFMGMWNSLYQCGDVSRPYDLNRYGFCRNLVTDKGLIYWIDESYVAPDDYRKIGVPCKWRASKKFFELVLQSERDTLFSTSKNKQFLTNLSDYQSLFDGFANSMGIGIEEFYKLAGIEDESIDCTGVRPTRILLLRPHLEIDLPSLENIA